MGHRSRIILTKDMASVGCKIRKLRFGMLSISCPRVIVKSQTWNGQSKAAGLRTSLSLVDTNSPKYRMTERPYLLQKVDSFNQDRNPYVTAFLSSKISNLKFRGRHKSPESPPSILQNVQSSPRTSYQSRAIMDQAKLAKMQQSVRIGELQSKLLLFALSEAIAIDVLSRYTANTTIRI